MTARRTHGILLVAGLPTLLVLSLLSLSLLHRLDHRTTMAAVWAIATAGSHGVIGWFLWAGKYRRTDGGIRSGIALITLRFAIGTGGFLTGIVENRGIEVAYAAIWVVCFLFLTVSESVLFAMGVQEL